MAKFRCRLCGGKLVNNRCTFCGLDNSCYDLESSYQETVSRQPEQPIQPAAAHQPSPEQNGTTVHQPPPAQHKTVQQPSPVKPSAGRPIYKNGVPLQKKRVGAAGITVIVIVILILVSLLGSAGSALIDFFHSMTYGSAYSDNYDLPAEDSDPYAFVTRDIPDEGDSYETVLGTGVYQTGVHLPEGVYRVKLLEGLGSMSISDSENSIYDYTYFGTDEEYSEVTEKDDIRLYNGAELQIDQGVLLQLSTENAQPLSETAYPSPETDTYLLSEGQYETDADGIPEGIYDISVDVAEDDPYGYASITLLYPNGYSAYFWADSPEGAVSADGYSSAGVKNVVLPSGTQISVEYGDIILTPGALCYDVDYENYPSY